MASFLLALFYNNFMTLFTLEQITSEMALKYVSVFKRQQNAYELERYPILDLWGLI